MSVVRVNKTKNYTVMSNLHLRDGNISLTAKGLLCVALSLPEDWEYSIEGLCKYCKCGKDKMRSAMKELKDNGYLQILKTNAQNGTFDYEYVFYEKKQPDMEKPHLVEPDMVEPDMVEPDMVEPDMVNPPQLNTKKEQSTKEQNTPIIPKRKTKNGTLTIETIKEEIEKREFSPAVLSKLYEWVEYKEERKSQYKTVKGLNMQLSQLENVINKRGEKAVLIRMDEAMSREWVGWNFDTIDAFDNNRPYIQNLDKKPRYKEVKKTSGTSYEEECKNFKEATQQLRERLRA